MSASLDRPARADAVRNAERILRAARRVYAECGPDVQMSTIAERANVGDRTLYRHYPTKADLLRGALQQSIDEDLSPAIESSVRADNPLHGLADLVDAAISLGAREHCILEASRKAGVLTDDVSSPLYAGMLSLVVRAQEAGLVRADLVADDLPRLIAMLHSVLWTMDPRTGGWRRYLTLLFDAISTRPGHADLGEAPTLRTMTQSDNWPI